MPRDVLVIGGTLAGTAAALAAARSRARVHLVVQGAVPPPPSVPFPADVRPRAADAVALVPVPAPEAPEVFSLRARRVRRWLDELGVAPDGLWPAGLHASLLQRCAREGVGVDEESTALSLVHGPRGVSGAVLLSKDKAVATDADAVIVACGDLAALYTASPVREPLSGLALGTQAGAEAVGLEQIAFFDGVPGRSCGGFAVDGRGLTSVPGLVAVGAPASAPWSADAGLAPVEDVVRGLEAGAFAAPPGRAGEARIPPDIDEPLPDGFVGPKWDRLRDVWTKAAGPRRTVSAVAAAETMLQQLRGEAMDFARARLQPELHLLSHAADAAVVGIRALRNPPAGLHHIDG